MATDKKKAAGGGGGSGFSKEELEKIKAAIASAGSDLEDRTDDVAGYWVCEEVPIYCRPLNVKVMDSKLNAGKPSALVTVLALGPTLISNKDKGEHLCKKGDTVGIWYKPGMKGILNCAGAPTTITREPGKDKDMGKPGQNKMKAFSVKAKGGERLMIVEDNRKASAAVATIFDVKKPTASKVEDEEDDDADASDDWRSET